MDQQKPTPRPRRRRGLRIFGIILLIFLLLLVAAFFVGTSEAFLKSVVLPRVSKSMNANITVEKATLKPFSEARFTNLKVVTTGTEPLLSAQEVHARYNLMQIIRGNIVVSEVTIASPTIIIVENPDGSRNVDAITNGKKEEKPKPSKPSKAPQVDLKKFVLSNATLRYIKNHKGGGRDVDEISNLNITLDNLKNGASGKLAIAAHLAANQNPPAPATNGQLEATLNGNFDFALKPDLMPASVKGGTDLAVDKAAGGFDQVAGLKANLAADLTPTELKQVTLRFQRNGATLGEVRASGPLDTSKREGKLAVELVSVDRNLLNLVGAASGLDFGPTTINSSNQIELSQGGAVITTIGQVNVGKFAVTRGGQTTPTLDLQTAYHLAVDQSDKSANIQVFTLTGVQNQRQILRGELAKSMKVAWGDNAAPAGDSSFNLNITGLNLADWKPFVGNVAPAGTVGLNLQLVSEKSGKVLTFDTASDVQGLTVNFGSNALANLTVKLNAQGSATELKKFDFRTLRLAVAQQNQPMLSVSGSGNYDKDVASADMKVEVESDLPNAFKALQQTNATASAGKLAVKAHLVQSKADQTASGNLSLADFTGQYGTYRFDHFGTTTDFDVTKNGDRLQIRKAGGKLTSAGNQGGAFDVAGDYDTAKKSGQFDIKLADFNQNGLRPFLESMLGDKKLVSVALNSTTSAKLEGGDASVKANLQLANLVVSDPKQQIPQTPLEAKLQLDASMVKNVVDLRQFQTTLTPTDRAKNELQLTGKIDMSNSNAMTGSLKLASDSLDVTRYYDLFAKKPETKPAAAQTKPAAAPTSPSPPSQGGEGRGEEGRSSQPQKEPDPVKLPVQNLTVDATIGRFYLRELQITNLQTGIKVDQSTIAIQPLQLAINGSPVTGSVNADLSSPGWKYQLALNSGQIPLEPLANTFVPDKKGMYKGNLITGLKIDGAGITGKSLQKSLSGNFNFSFTNANIQIVNPQLKGFLVPIAAFLGAPDLLDSPINQLELHGKAANGKINVDQLLLVSEAFMAQSAGPISITDDFMKSTFGNWPMHFSIRSSLAQKIRIAPKSTSPDQKYAALPDFIQVTGALDAPKPKLDLNIQSIAGTVLERVAPKIPGLDQRIGNIGNILGGSQTNRPTIQTNTPSTNTTNQQIDRSTIQNLLDRLRKK